MLSTISPTQKEPIMLSDIRYISIILQGKYLNVIQPRENPQPCKHFYQYETVITNRHLCAPGPSDHTWYDKSLHTILAL
jgi:hypothetical protein